MTLLLGTQELSLGVFEGSLFSSKREFFLSIITLIFSDSSLNGKSYVSPVKEASRRSEIETKRQLFVTLLTDKIEGFNG